MLKGVSSLQYMQKSIGHEMLYIESEREHIQDI